MTELAGIIILGIFAQWIAWRTRVPAILPLILIGLFVGPVSTLFTEDGQKWLAPTYDASNPNGLFPGDMLFSFVSLAIGIILFEGGLTLNRREIAGVGPAILKLITVGSVVTFIGAGIGAHFIMDLNWPISFLFAGLIIVTGPTVIAPILRNVPLTRNVAAVLKWEGILIDPIGALVAVLMFEFILSSGHGTEIAFSQHAFTSFTKIVLIGLALGAIAAYALYQLIKLNLIPHYLLNVFTLALVLAVFVFSDMLEHESGLLSVVVMGTVLGNLDVPKLKEILDFKESISVLLISMLFILLAANIDVEHIMLLNDWRCLLLFLVVVLILRPLGVFLSTKGSELRTNEKLFISWVGPRGIVAAGIASLFGIKLDGVIDGAEYITPLVFMIVLGTVLLNATTARLIAKALKVCLEVSEGIFIVGANKPARMIANYLQNNNRHVVLVDNNESSIKQAKNEGLNAIQGNIYSDDLEDDFELMDMGYLISMTSSGDINQFASEKFRHVMGERGAYRLITADELKAKDKSLLKGVFSYRDDFINFSEAARDFPAIHEMPILNIQDLKVIMDKLSNIEKSVPLFTKAPDGNLEIIPYDLDELKVEEGSLLVYMGEKLEI